MATRHRGRTRRTRHRSRLRVRARACPAAAGAGDVAPPVRPAWQPSTSTVSYTPQQVRDLEPVRGAAVARTQTHDLFLCHAWPDR